jgi:oligosaccharide repeat unit polymerase
MFGFAYFMKDRIVFEDRYGGLSTLFCRWVYIAFIISVAGFMSSKGNDKNLKHWAIILGLITVGFFGFTSSRNAIFIGFIVSIGVFFVATWRPKISVLKMVFSKQGFLILFVIAAMVVIGNIRAISSSQKYGKTIPEAINATFNSAFGNHENVLWLVSNDFEYEYGKTYLAGFVNVYPRALWLNKPVGGGPVMKNLVNPGSYEVGRKGSSSLTTGMVTESYMNGGISGLILVAAITGLYLRVLARLRARCLGPWSLAFYTYTVFTFAFSMTHNEFSGAYTRWLIDIFPLFWGWVIFEFVNRKTLSDLQEELYMADFVQELPYGQE